MRTEFRRMQPKRLAHHGSARFPAAPGLREQLSPWREGPAVATLPEARQEEDSSEDDSIELRPAGSPRSDTLHLYLCEIGQVKLLTPQEEIALAERIKHGDELAREQM